ncbi:50S ribosomal protein L15 [Gryllotalpicola sp.]|uniref:50S ribosomal protein L15 n=1 Tax=Gryllotalpicola sp. TaxID=1932787 RepID=UPI0026397759|nr:50S ribosomal protein L15 [Gryllotalpicola sp.]
MADETPAAEPAKKPAARTAAPKAASTAKAAAPKAGAKTEPTAKAPAAKAAAEKSVEAAAETPTVKAVAPKAAPKTAAETAEKASLLKVHHLRPAAGARKDRTRVGRGEGSKGKTAGRGTKGTKARYQVAPGFQGGQLNSVMRAPKLRGFKNPFRTEYQVVNLAKLAELYPKGGDVTVADLVAKGAVRKNELVKVLGDGDIAVKLTVSVDRVSSTASKKIVAAGGEIK